MKKYLLTAAGLAVALGLTAQSSSQNPEVSGKNDTPTKIGSEEMKFNTLQNYSTRGGGSSPAIQSFGDTILTETFSDGLNGDPGNGSWNNVGNADWEYRGPNTTPDNSIGSRGAYASTQMPINSPTQGNGFLIFDSDYLDNDGVVGNFGNGPNPTPHMGELESPAMDFSGYSNIYLDMHSFYRRFRGTGSIVFSTDGGSTYGDTLFIFDSDYVVNQASDNSVHTVVPIPNNIPGNPNVRAKFVFDGVTFTNDQGLSGYYFWQIDDIQFVEAPDHDLSMDQVYYNSPGLIATNALHTNVYYARVPAYQFEEEQFDFGVDITNKGLQTQTNTRGEFFIDGDKLGETSATDLGPDGQQDSLGVTSPIPAPQKSPGFYNMDFVSSSDFTDQWPIDDTLRQRIEITDSTYSWAPLENVRDAGIAFTGITDYRMGVAYDVHQADTITSFEFFVSRFNDSINHPEITFTIWQVNQSTGVADNIIAQKIETLDPSMHSQWNTFQLNGNVGINPGRYVVGWEASFDTIRWAVDGRGADSRHLFLATDPNNDLTPWDPDLEAIAIGFNLKGAGCPELTAQTSVLQEAGCGESDGVAVVTPNESNVTVRWPDGTEGDTNSALSATTHTVELIQGICRTTVDVVVSNTNAPVANQANDGLEITSGITANFVNAQEAGDLTLAQDAELTADFSGGTQPYQYVWDPSGDTTTSASISNLGAGSQYRVTIVDDNDCLGISRRVTITQPPVMKVFITKEHSEDHAETTLRAHVIGGTAPYDYTWSDNESGETITVDEEIADQSYSVTVRDHDGNGGQAGECGGETYATEADADQVTIGDDEIYIDGCEYVTSIEEINISEGIKVYPNPNNGQFNVEFNDLNGTYTVTMRNLVGQIVGQERINVSGVNVSTMDYTNVANGVYILEVTSDKGERATYKVNKK